jgi:hypothetical protein
MTVEVHPSVYTATSLLTLRELTKRVPYAPMTVLDDYHMKHQCLRHIVNDDTEQGNDTYHSYLNNKTSHCSVSKFFSHSYFE